MEFQILPETAESQEVSSFPADGHKPIVKMNNNQRLTESGRTMTISINHNRSTALERSVINYVLVCVCA